MECADLAVAAEGGLGCQPGLLLQVWRLEAVEHLAAAGQELALSAVPLREACPPCSLASCTNFLHELVSLTLWCMMFLHRLVNLCCSVSTVHSLLGEMCYKCFLWVLCNWPLTGPLRLVRGHDICKCELWALWAAMSGTEVRTALNMLLLDRLRCSGNRSNACWRCYHLLRLARGLCHHLQVWLCYPCGVHYTAQHSASSPPCRRRLAPYRAHNLRSRYVKVCLPCIASLAVQRNLALHLTVC